MKLPVMTMVGFLVCGTAMAADYSVGIANLGQGTLGGGTAVNLYVTRRTGVELLQQYIFQQKDFTGNLSSPLLLAMNPAHDFVYVVYTGLSEPDLVGFSIKADGLVYEWQQEFMTADAGLQGSTLLAGANYVIATNQPFGPYIHVYSNTGQELMSDYADGSGGGYTVSGHVDLTRRFYYSCRASSSSAPATFVSVYRFEPGIDVDTSTASPVATSTDSAFINSWCN